MITYDLMLSKYLNMCVSTEICSKGKRGDFTYFLQAIITGEISFVGLTPRWLIAIDLYEQAESKYELLNE